MPETQTFTYDPTEDALIDEANEARDAENLEVGEKMIEEQEKLLAGKYKTTEDLEKAYLELQKKQGEESNLKVDKEPTEGQEEAQTEVQFYKEDGSVGSKTSYAEGDIISFALDIPEAALVTDLTFIISCDADNGTT